MTALVIIFSQFSSHEVLRDGKTFLSSDWQRILPLQFVGYMKSILYLFIRVELCFDIVVHVEEVIHVTFIAKHVEQSE